jgi:hypothetical protein
MKTLKIGRRLFTFQRAVVMLPIYSKTEHSENVFNEGSDHNHGASLDTTELVIYIPWCQVTTYHADTTIPDDLKVEG